MINILVLGGEMNKHLVHLRMVDGVIGFDDDQTGFQALPIGTQLVTDDIVPIGLTITKGGLKWTNTGHLVDFIDGEPVFVDS